MKPWSVMSTVLLVDNKYLARVLFGKPKCSSLLCQQRNISSGG